MPRLARLLAGSFALACLACSQSSTPAAPSSVPLSTSPADFSGIWQGEYRITTCSGERDCWFRVGTTRPYVLRLTQSGLLVTGVFEAFSFVVDVNGEVAQDGSLSLSGSRPSTGGYDGRGEVRVSGVTLRLDAQNGLAGDVAYSVDPPPGINDYPGGTLSHSGVVLSAARGPLPLVSPTALAAYEGTWSGTFVVDSCVFSGWADCYPEIRDGAYPLSLDLHVDAGGLVGELVLATTHIPVTASVTSTGLAVQGATSTVVSGGASATELRQWNTTRDVYDRLSGGFEYARRYVRSAGDPNDSIYQARLAGVTRRP